MFIEGHTDTGDSVIINCNSIVDVVEMSSKVGYKTLKCRVDLLTDKSIILYESYDAVKKTLDYICSRNRRGVFKISDDYKPIITESSGIGRNNDKGE